MNQFNIRVHMTVILGGTFNLKNVFKKILNI